MLKQLARLNVEADGRYATDQELQFFTDYLESVEQRISAYEKLRESEDRIIHHIELRKRAFNDDLFKLGERDITEICRRDITNVLRCSAAAMLIDDLDRLREGLLIWYQTIVRSFGYSRYAQVNYQIMQEIVKQYLSDEEADLLLPALQLDHTILSA